MQLPGRHAEVVVLRRGARAMDRWRAEEAITLGIRMNLERIELVTGVGLGNRNGLSG